MKTTQNHRRIRYLDDNLQKWLLVALVLIEVLMVVGAIAFLYQSLLGIIEESMYQIHFGNKVSVFQHLMSQGGKILGVFLIVNLVMLIITDQIWAIRVKKILSDLAILIRASLELDFSRKPHVHCTHPVLMHAVAWRHAEQHRIDIMRKDIQSLPSELPHDLAEAERLLSRIKENLPC